LAKAFGLEMSPIKHTYEYGGETLEEALRKSTEFETFKFEYKDGSNQYLKEDLYYGLPPLVSIANQIGVSIPTIQDILQIFSIIDGEDYLNKGVNAKKMGLEGLNAEEIIQIAEKGF
jgi:hypothetical protein